MTIVCNVYSGQAKGGLNGAKGFTLLEALVAIAIAAMALAALSRAVGQSAKSANDLSSRQQAAIVARAVISSGTYAEDFLQSLRGNSTPWEWQISVNPQPITVQEVGGAKATSTSNVAHIRIDVSLQGSSQVAYSLNAWKPYRTTR